MGMPQERAEYVAAVVAESPRRPVGDVAFEAYTAGYLAGVQSQVLKQAERIIAGKPSAFKEIAEAVH